MNTLSTHRPINLTQNPYQPVLATPRPYTAKEEAGFAEAAERVLPKEWFPTVSTAVTDLMADPKRQLFMLGHGLGALFGAVGGALFHGPGVVVGGLLALPIALSAFFNQRTLNANLTETMRRVPVQPDGAAVIRDLLIDPAIGQRVSNHTTGGLKDLQAPVQEILRALS